MDQDQLRMLLAACLSLLYNAMTSSAYFGACDLSSALECILWIAQQQLLKRDDLVAFGRAIIANVRPAYHPYYRLILKKLHSLIFLYASSRTYHFIVKTVPHIIPGGDPKSYTALQVQSQTAVIEPSKQCG